MSLILAAASAEPPAGWGKLIGLLVAGAVFWAFTGVHKRWLSTRANPSPTGSQKAVEGVNPQVKAPGDPIDPSKAVVVRKGLDLDVFVGDRLARNERTSQIMRDARRAYRVSESTIKRSLRRARGGGA